MRGYVWFWLFALAVTASLGMISVLIVDFFFPNPPWGELPPVGYVAAMAVAIVSVGLMLALSMARPEMK